MTCETILPQLTAFFDGELSAEATADIEAHLKMCSDCTEARERQSALSETLAAWAVSAPDITPSVMQAITNDELTLLREEMRELRAEIRLLREELAAQRRPTPPTWFPAKTTHYAQMEENDPWNLVRS